MLPVGKVESLATSVRKGERKRSVERARFIEAHGIEGDAHAGRWHRQVSLLLHNDVEQVRRAGLPNLSVGDFAENTVVSGLDLHGLGLGSRLRLGRDAVLSVTQIGKACHTRCQIYQITGDCIMPRLGLFAKVERSGEVRIGDPARVEHTVPRDLVQAVVLSAGESPADAARAEEASRPLVRHLEAGLPAHVFATETLAGSKHQTSNRLKHYADGHSIDLVLVVEGPGAESRGIVSAVAKGALHQPATELEVGPARRSGDTSLAIAGVRNSALVVGIAAQDIARGGRVGRIVDAVRSELARRRSHAAPAGREERA